MTPNVIKKYEATTFIATLENLKKLKYEAQNTNKNRAQAIYYRIEGYIRALEDCGIITKKEGAELWSYYAITPSEEKQKKMKEHFKDLVKLQEKIAQKAADAEAKAATEEIKKHLNSEK